MRENDSILVYIIFLIALFVVPFSSASLSDGLVGHWTFDEGVGEIAHDSSGNNLHGTYMGNISKHDGGIGGYSITNYGDVSDRVDLPQSPLLNLTSLTYSAWVYPLETPLVYVGIIGMGNDYFGLRTNSGGGVIAPYLNNSGSYKFLYSYFPFKFSEWMFVSITVDVQGMNVNRTLYVNGKIISSSLNEDGILSEPVKYIGTRNLGNTPFSGRIDEVRIYERALSGDELTQIYQEGLNYLNFQGESIENNNVTVIVNNSVVNNTVINNSFINESNREVNLTNITTLNENIINLNQSKESENILGKNEQIKDIEKEEVNNELVIISGNPNGILPSGIRKVGMNVTTNFYSECRYSVNKDEVFDDMEIFESDYDKGFIEGVGEFFRGVWESISDIFSVSLSLMTGRAIELGKEEFLHSTELSGLEDGKSYSYYVKCKDSNGKINPDEFVISFSVAAQRNLVIAEDKNIMADPADLPCGVGPKTISAHVTASSNSICLEWPKNAYRQNLSISRRVYSSHPSSWQDWTEIYNIINNANESGEYCDTNVNAGIHYEYKIMALAEDWICRGSLAIEPWSHFWSFQYINAGTLVPLNDIRGNVILLVESSLATPLASELATLENDLIGDGYKVFRHNVSASDVNESNWKTSVTSTKTLIRNDYNTDTGTDWSIFIIGHVSIPYSGDSSPGSHNDNIGAHPADWYYADMNESLWTDSTVSDTSSDWPHHWNIPGDGKFDQSFLPSAPELRIGRIDLRNMPAFGKSEVELIRQYLNRNHAWRHKQFTVRDLGLVNYNNNNNLIYEGRPFDVHSIYSSFFGGTNYTLLGSWLDNATTPSNSYLFAASSGNGQYTEDLQIGTTAEFAATPLYAVFTSMYGSYYGDWDSAMHPDIVLQAPLADEGYVVSHYYRENVMNIDSSSMGGDIGYELYAMGSNWFVNPDKRYLSYGWIYQGSQNIVSEGIKNYNTLFGDPTLRVRVVAPPTNVAVNAEGTDNVISWTSAADTNIQGYHIYRAPIANQDNFTRITNTPVATASFRDVNGATSAYRYMVRTVKLEQSASRSYYTASQGIFVDGTSVVNCSLSNIKCVDDTIGATQEYSTIQACADVSQPGDTCLIFPGNYPEYVLTKNGGTSESNRITFKANGKAIFAGMLILDPYVTLEGFDITGDLRSKYIWIYPAGNYCNIYNNNMHDGNGVGGIYFEGLDNAASYCKITGNNFSNLTDIFATIKGSGHRIENNTFEYLNSMDYLRLFGKDHIVKRNIFRKGTSIEGVGNHPDWVQSFACCGFENYYSYNMTLEENWISDLESQIMMTEQDGNPNLRNWTLRKNVFVNVSENTYAHLSNMNIIGNTFYRTAYTLSGIVIGATLDTGNPFGTVLKDNVFLESGSSPELPNSYNGFYTFNGVLLAGLDSVIHDQAISLSILQDLYNNGYLATPNLFGADLTNKARALTDISQFVLGSEFNAYKSAVYTFLMQTVTADTHARNTFIADYNYAAGAESTGFLPKSNSFCNSEPSDRKFSFCETHGINGGNPKLQDLSNPIGPDGIPFTDDDGLIPLSNSSLCGAGEGGSDIGAYPCATSSLINGICGVSNNACSAGILNDLADNATHYLWNCNGRNGGSNAACTLLKPSVVCGNSIIESGETCDTNSQSCIITGYSGTQNCNAQCNGWNSCTTTLRCGDGILNGNEVCDGSIQACLLGGLSGTQICSPGCSGWNSCVTTNNCGDGVIDANEFCDGINITSSCSYGGSVSCSLTCTVNYTSCNSAPSNEEVHSSGGGGGSGGTPRKTVNNTANQSGGEVGRVDNKNDDLEEERRIENIIETLGGGEKPINKGIGWIIFGIILGVFISGIMVLGIVLTRKIKRMNILRNLMNTRQSGLK